MGNKLPGGAKAAPPQTSLREATEALLTVPGGMAQVRVRVRVRESKPNHPVHS